jgi:predicted glutamine amidotransferase
MHNGLIRGFSDLRRDLVLAVDPHLYPDIEGTTDSALLFFLALTLGLADDPFEAVARAVGQVESIADAHQIAYQVQMTVATLLQRRAPTARAPPRGREPASAW